VLPECIDDYVDENNPVRVVEAFVDNLDLGTLGFGRVTPAETGRPGYHPAILLKLYVYGYLNRVPSSRRLEREAQRNLELIWLTGHLAPDFKTIADFRRDNGPEIQGVCRNFVLLCRRMGLFSETLVAIDGSKFKAANNRDKNFTPAKLRIQIAQAEESIARYMTTMDAADRREDAASRTRSAHLQEKIATVREQMRHLQELEVAIVSAPDRQISRTDPDARSMATHGKGSGIVGYNVQTAVEAEHHLIVAHEVSNIGNDRGQLANMAHQAQGAMGQNHLTVLADRGYYAGPEVLACALDGNMPYVPKPLTSGTMATGHFGKQDFVYLSRQDSYRCPAGQRLTWFCDSHEEGKLQRVYRTRQCPDCPIRAQCTAGTECRIRRWEHEEVLDAMQRRLDMVPQAMTLRRRTVEHPFGTLKAWMGATHFLTRTLRQVSTEMSLNVLAYNIKRVIAIMGVRPLMAAITG
jgi:transposase